MLTLPFEGLATNLRTIDNGHCCAAWVCKPEYAVRMLFGLKSSQKTLPPALWSLAGVLATRSSLFP